MPWTNKGKEEALKVLHLAEPAPEDFYMALIASTSTEPSASTAQLSDLTEVTAGGGYDEGGKIVTAETPVTVLDDTTLSFQDVAYLAAGGSLPETQYARWAVLTDDAVVEENRNVWYWWDLVSPRQVSTGQTLTLVDAAIRLLHTS